MSSTQKFKEEVQKQRLKLTAHTLQIYNEKFMKGEIENPLSVLVDCMLNAPRDADKINASKELIRMCFQRPPQESEVVVKEDVEDMNDAKRQRLAELMAKMQGTSEPSSNNKDTQD